MKSKIKIKNSSSGCVVIDIEGIIGVSEKSQFEQPNSKVATYEKFKTQTEKISKIAASEVVVNIRSAGGNVNDALLIYDSLRGLTARITTNCFGYVASAATIIAQAASPGRRFISANSLYLIHNSISSCDGNAGEISQTVELLKTTDAAIAGIYAARSGREVDMFRVLMDENGGNGRWLSPQQVVEIALADAIIDVSAVKNASTKIISQLGLPPVPGPVNKLSLTDKLQQKWREIIGLMESMIYDDKECLLADEQEAESVVTADTEVEVSEIQISQIQDTEEFVHQDSITESEVELLSDEAIADQTLDTEIPLNMVENAIQELEMEHWALPTTTVQVEDPSIDEVKPRSNQFAYSEDIKQFK